MATSPDFKAMVMASVNRMLTEGRLPRRGEVVLIGQGAAGGLIRLRISPRYRWFDALMVRGFVKQKALDRLGILISDNIDQDQPKGLLALLDRAAVEDQGAGADPRLARLAHAARQEWSGIRPPMLSLFSRPWPTALIAFVLALDLILGLERTRLALAGQYSWFPVISHLSAEVLYAIYLLIVAVTVFALWREMKLGYAMAFTVAAVQLVRSIVLTVASAQSATIGSLAAYLLGAWLFPAFILLCLGILYWDGRSRV